MAKKKSTAKRKVQKWTPPGNNLPQNILPMGERVEEDKNIYISQKTYKKIHKFTQNKTKNESGGVLIGSVVSELGKQNIMIDGFVEAKYCEATPTTLTFTHQTWDYIHKEIEAKYPGGKIVGWIHTHPDFGIFLSDYDKFIHQNFFSDENQVAYVVDPIQNIEGFYFWINEKLEKCKGFYIYEETGMTIDISNMAEPAEPAAESGRSMIAYNILLAALAVAVVMLVFFNISLQSDIDRLETEQKKMQETVQKNEHGIRTWDSILSQMIGFTAYPEDLPAGQPSAEQIPAEGESGVETPPAEAETQPEEAETQPAETPTAETEAANGGI